MYSASCGFLGGNGGVVKKTSTVCTDMDLSGKENKKKD